MLPPGVAVRELLARMQLIGTPVGQVEQVFR